MSRRHEKFLHFIQEMEGLVQSKDTDLSGRAVGTTCRVGCSACCELLLVYVTFPETVFFTYRWMQSTTSQKFEQLKKRLRAQLKILEKTGSDSSAYALRKSPCVLLENGRCSVYEERPWACRSYFVYNPAEDCRKGRLLSHPRIGDLADEYFKAMLDLTEQTGIPTIFAPLPVAMTWATLFIEKGADHLNKALSEVKPGSVLDMWTWNLKFAMVQPMEV